jgi:anti-anti-sigma factor
MMAEEKVHIGVRSPAGDVCVLDIEGWLSGAAREALMAAWEAANGGGAQTLVLNLSGLEAVDGSGVGLLIELQALTRRRKQRLLAYGLAPSLVQVFALTHLDEAMHVHADEAQALAGAGSPGRS